MKYSKYKKKKGGEFIPQANTNNNPLNTTMKLWDTTKSKGINLFNSTRNYSTNLLNNTRNYASNLMNKTRNLTSNLFNKTRNYTSNLLANSKAYGYNLFNNTKALGSNITSKFMNTTKRIGNVPEVKPPTRGGKSKKLMISNN